MTPLQLKATRKNLEISQFKLSKLAKVSRYNIALFETNCRKFTSKELTRIADALTAESEKQDVANKKIKSRKTT